MLLKGFGPQEITCENANIVLRQNKRYLSEHAGTFLVVQWLRLHDPNAAGRGSIPGQGTRSCMHAATKTQRSQINKYLKKKERKC